ncbi:MAG: MarR family winged helix-turn-helix transcriptional regulator [Proteobacteria bacterium]|nr:MarR family winged helix-turn-helix transcriptional regulator [Pseudomonadota bacterium]
MTVKENQKGTTKRQLKLGILGSNIGYLTRVARNLTQHRSGEYINDLGFIGGQIAMLGLIHANDGVSQNELSRALLMRKSQVTGMIQDLVTRGYVKRIELGADRRYKSLSLTKTGSQIWLKASDRIMQHSDEVLSGLTVAERKKLLELLLKMVSSNLEDPEFQVV